MTHEPDFTNLFFCRKLEQHKYFHIQGKKCMHKMGWILVKTHKNLILGTFSGLFGHS